MLLGTFPHTITKGDVEKVMKMGIKNQEQQHQEGKRKRNKKKLDWDKAKGKSEGEKNKEIREIAQSYLQVR